MELAILIGAMTAPFAIMYLVKWQKHLGQKDNPDSLMFLPQMFFARGF